MRVIGEGARALTGSMLVLALAACGGGATAPQGTRAARDTPDTLAYCTAKMAFETAPSPQADFQNGTPAELAEAGRTYATTTMRPILNDLLATAPAEVLDSYNVLNKGVTQFEATGDFFLFNAPEYGTAQTTTHLFDRANCGWTRVDVAATDFAFAGVPSTLPAGTTLSFDLANQSDSEIHEIAIFKMSDDATEPIKTVLDSKDEDIKQQATLVASALAAPDNSAYKVTELAPGNYAMVCTVHVGATPKNPQGTGPKHYTKGMLTEFTVE